VASIPDIAEKFAQSIHAEWDGRIVHDEFQGVYVTFFANRAAREQAMVELVAPADEISPVTNFLKRGGGLHHFCFEVDDLAQQLRDAQQQGAIVVRKPLPAAAFENRRIGWVYTPEKLLVEYLERQSR
jgi:methylmalonyl-CoA/ethylmalonyl-CoA epimerase